MGCAHSPRAQEGGTFLLPKYFLLSILGLCSSLEFALKSVQAEPIAPPASAPDVERARRKDVKEGLVNPSGDSLSVGNGTLGSLLGIPKDSPLQIGGFWMGNGTSQLLGGLNKSSTFAQVAIYEVRLNLEKARLLRGSELWVQGLQMNASNPNTNAVAGSFQEINNLVGAPPYNRTELYTYGIKQNFLDRQLQVSIGKVYPGFYFGSVSRPIPTGKPGETPAPNTYLLMNAPYAGPTFLGPEPSLPDSTLGGVINLQPNYFRKRVYLTVGLFDGRNGTGATAIPTGLRPPSFSGPKLLMAEAGGVWSASSKQLPGLLSLGLWHQGGTITSPCPDGAIGCLSQNGATGFYGYAVQRLADFGKADSRGKVTAFLLGGYTGATTYLATSSVSGGINVDGLFKRRPLDSYGFGWSWAKLNDNPSANWGLNSNELMFQAYARWHAGFDIYVQPALSYLPIVGFSNTKAPSLAFTLQLLTRF